MSYQTKLAKALSGESTVESIEPAKPKKKMSVEDWLRADHQRNAFNRDIEEIKNTMALIHLWLCVSSGLLALVFFMQQIIFFAKL